MRSCKGKASRFLALSADLSVTAGPDVFSLRLGRISQHKHESTIEVRFIVGPICPEYVLRGEWEKGSRFSPLFTNLPAEGCRSDRTRREGERCRYRLPAAAAQYCPLPPNSTSCPTMASAGLPKSGRIGFELSIN